MSKVGLHSLTLVFSPMSNQEAEWLWEDADVRSLVSNSKFYMIGQRPETKFTNFEHDVTNNTIKFSMEDGTFKIDNIELPVNQFPIPDGYNYCLELGEKLIRISAVKDGTKPTLDDIIHWFTPYRLALFYSNNEIYVDGFSEFRKFTTFDLYYVGISKKGNSFSRLFDTAHEKRSRILGNESQIIPTARLTDELTIFLYNVADLQIHTYSLSDSAEEWFKEKLPIDPEILAADAEKAFIKILRAKYNTQVYSSYPISRDGLWGAGFDRYSFFVNECFSFVTPTATIKGAKLYNFDPNDQPDLIAIEDGKVELLTPEEVERRVKKMLYE